MAGIGMYDQLFHNGHFDKLALQGTQSDHNLAPVLCRDSDANHEMESAQAGHESACASPVVQLGFVASFPRLPLIPHEPICRP